MAPTNVADSSPNSTIALRSMRLRNFKGTREFSFNPTLSSASVRGDNGTGKTTLADAWFWCLFGYDSHGRADFDVKTRDEYGVVIHGIEHRVIVELDVDGEAHVFERALTERWVKRRGETKEKLKGHETKYWHNTVPVKAGEYATAVETILCSAYMLRCLSDPMYVAALDWRERRELLVDLAGFITQEQVVESDPELADLDAALAGHHPDAARLVHRDRRRALNAEISQIPIRIDEATKGILEDGDERSSDVLEVEIEAGEAARLRTLERRSELTAGGDVGRRKARLIEVKSRIAELELEDRLKRRSDGAELEKDLATAKGRLDVARIEETSCESGRRVARLNTSSRAQQVESIRGEYNDLFYAPPENIGADPGTCPACGSVGKCPACGHVQEPSAGRAEADAEERNLAKAKALTSIQDRGLAAEVDYQAQLAATAKAEGGLSLATAKVFVAEQDVERLECEVRDAKAEVETLDPAPQLAPLRRTESELVRAIDQAGSGSSETIAALDASLDEQEKALKALKAILDARCLNKLIGERTLNLNERERELAVGVEEAERALWLIERFVQERAILIAGAVNTRFKVAEFKLFDVQLNEGIRECCEILVDGVPWASVNNAGQIKAGLDIVRTLQHAHGISVPVWVDRAESITDVPEMPCQVFTLGVVEGVDELAVLHS